MAPSSHTGTVCGVSTWTIVGVICLVQVVGCSNSSPGPGAHSASPVTCVSFRATEDCSPYGSRKPQADRRCDRVIPSHVAGYCECDFGRTVRLVGCGHANFTCLRECLLTQSDSCSINPQTGSISCQTNQPTVNELQQQMQQLHKQQMKMQSQIKKLRYTNSQLMASLHAAKVRQKIDSVTECSSLTERVLGAIVPVVEDLSSGNVSSNRLKNLRTVYEDLQSYVQKHSTIAQSYLMRFLAEATLFQFEPEALTRLVSDAGVTLHGSERSSTKYADPKKHWTNGWRFVDVKGHEHWAPRSNIHSVISSEQLISIGQHVLNGLKSKLEAQGEKGEDAEAKQAIEEALRIVEWVKTQISNDSDLGLNVTTENPYRSGPHVVVSVPPRHFDAEKLCFWSGIEFFTFDYALDYLQLLNRCNLRYVEDTRSMIAKNSSRIAEHALSSNTWLRPRSQEPQRYASLGKHWTFNGKEWSLQARVSTLGKYGNIPPSRTAYEADLNFARQEAVRHAFHHAWSSYKSFAYGHDELQPLTKSGTQTLCNMSLTLIDSLDTLFLMGYFDDFKNASDYLRENFSLTSDVNTNLFETTIRVIGGLLSAYDLSRDELLLELALRVADRMIETGAFSTRTGLPMGTLNLRNLTSFNPKWVNGASSLSEVATIQLEFHRLTELSGNTTYRELADNVIRVLYNKRMPYGLWPIYVDPNTAEFEKQAPVTLGARGDSAYEYLLKLSLMQKTKSEPTMRKDSFNVIHSFMNPSGVQYSEFDLESGMQPSFNDVTELRRFLDLVQRTETSCGEHCGDIFALVRHQYHVSLHGILTKMLSYSFSNGLAYLSELLPLEKNGSDGKVNSSSYHQHPKMDHLVCFTPGMLALGVDHGFGINGSLFALWSHMKWQESSTTARDVSLQLGSLIEELPFDRQKQLQQLMEEADTLFNESESAFFNISSLNEGRERILDVASLLTRSCYELYNRTATGLAPEIASFRQGNDTKSRMITHEPNLLQGRCFSVDDECHDISNASDQGLEDIVVHQDAKHSLLRPETVESLFVMWRVTHDPIYREWGWNIFQSMQQHALLDSGYSAVKSTMHVNKDALEVTSSLRKWHQRRIHEVGRCNAGCCPPRQNISASLCKGSRMSTSSYREYVTQEGSNLMNKMESFLLAETFKYLYLLFSDDESLSLDEWVFNTEGHPIRISR